MCVCVCVWWGSSFVCASFERPPRHQHPKLKAPHTHTHTHSLQRALNQVHSFTHARIQNTLSLHTPAHALITHAFPLPTVTGKQCPPLPSRSSTPPLPSSPPHPSPPLPSPHFTSPPTGSAPLPFFFVVGSCDRGIPSLLTPLMGWWCAQMKTMYFFFSNGSAELPQFPANCSSHIEVKLFRVTARRWQPPMLLCCCCCSGCSCTRQPVGTVPPFTFPRLFLSLSAPFLVQQSPSSGSDCGSKTPCCFCLKNGMGRQVGVLKKKGRVSKDPSDCPRNIHMLSDSCLSRFPLARWQARGVHATKGGTHTHPATQPHTHTHPCSPLFPIQSGRSSLRSGNKDA